MHLPFPRAAHFASCVAQTHNRHALIAAGILKLQKEMEAKVARGELVRDSGLVYGKRVLQKMFNAIGSKSDRLGVEVASQLLGLPTRYTPEHYTNLMIDQFVRFLESSLPAADDQEFGATDADDAGSDGLEDLDEHSIRAESAGGEEIHVTRDGVGARWHSDRIDYCLRPAELEAVSLFDMHEYKRWWQVERHAIFA